jgi:hypothetical protein
MATKIEWRGMGPSVIPETVEDPNGTILTRAANGYPYACVAVDSLPWADYAAENHAPLNACSPALGNPLGFQVALTKSMLNGKPVPEHDNFRGVIGEIVGLDGWDRWVNAQDWEEQGATLGRAINEVARMRGDRGPPVCSPEFFLHLTKDFEPSVNASLCDPPHPGVFSAIAMPDAPRIWAHLVSKRFRCAGELFLTVYGPQLPEAGLTESTLKRQIDVFSGISTAEKEGLLQLCTRKYVLPNQAGAGTRWGAAQHAWRAWRAKDSFWDGCQIVGAQEEAEEIGEVVFQRAGIPVERRNGAPSKWKASINALTEKMTHVPRKRRKPGVEQPTLF